MYVAIYTSFANLEDAKNIGRLLVKKRLVACANIVPKIFSIYHWQGKIEEEEEVILWCKTREQLVSRIKALIQEKHPYDLPAFVVYPISTGSEGYLKWINDETQPLNVN